MQDFVHLHVHTCLLYTSSPTKMQYARYRDGLSKLFTTRYEKARNSLQKVILRFPSTEAQKTLDKILRIEKEVNR